MEQVIPQKLQKEPSLLLDVWLQNCEATHLCCFKQMCGNLLWQPRALDPPLPMWCAEVEREGAEPSFHGVPF